VPIDESAIDGLVKRAEAFAASLAKRGNKQAAEDLRRRVALLTRIDELHRHADSLETVVGLYRALSVLTNEPKPAIHDAPVWAQTGALDDDAPTAAHGPAFRETAALRNRAFRLVAAALKGAGA
jgi:hypothetical protein